MGSGRNAGTAGSGMTGGAVAGDGAGTARLLGYAGLIPFAAGALACWLDPAWLPWAPDYALAAYGAVILSFVGAVHWGRLVAPGAARDPHAAGWFVWSNVPALLGWAALLLPAAARLALLIAALALAWAVDRHAFATGRYPAWFARLRTHLTLGACASLAAGLAGVLAR
ncbi:MAG TPA: DUF3429 domain-containing protein [Azospirillaceae bacterium]|nr:DUF3429 domain-containing protein [Azospirillaceae bacterium]